MSCEAFDTFMTTVFETLVLIECLFDCTSSLEECVVFAKLMLHYIHVLQWTATSSGVYAKRSHITLQLTMCFALRVQYSVCVVRPIARAVLIANLFHWCGLNSSRLRLFLHHTLISGCITHLCSHCNAVKPPSTKARRLQEIVQLSKEVERKGTLLKIVFQSISDYLFYLREIARALQPFGASVVLYLAAAVSDFYIPQDAVVGLFILTYLSDVS